MTIDDGRSMTNDDRSKNVLRRLSNNKDDQKGLSKERSTTKGSRNHSSKPLSKPTASSGTNSLLRGPTTGSKRERPATSFLSSKKPCATTRTIANRQTPGQTNERSRPKTTKAKDSTLRQGNLSSFLQPRAASSSKKTKKEQGASLQTPLSSTKKQTAKPRSNARGQHRLENAAVQDEKTSSSQSTKLSTQMMANYQPHLVNPPSTETIITKSDLAETTNVSSKSNDGTTAASPSSGIVHWLNHRATHGPHQYCLQQQAVPPIQPPPWKVAPWLQLSTPLHNHHRHPIRHVQWDPDGVLLAVLVTSTLVIYDWDSVIAADRQGRNRYGQQKSILQQERRRRRHLRSCADKDDTSRTTAQGAPPTNDKTNNTTDRNTTEATASTTTTSERNRSTSNQARASGCFHVSPTMMVPISLPTGDSTSSLGYLALHWNAHNPDIIALLHL